MARSVKWDDQALEYLENALEWIAKESYLQAENVERGILEKISQVSIHPEKFPPDKFKLRNNSRFRAFESYSFRVAYTFTDTEIHILRIRHIKQEPKEY